MSAQTNEGFPLLTTKACKLIDKQPDDGVARFYRKDGSGPFTYSVVYEQIFQEEKCHFHLNGARHFTASGMKALRRLNLKFRRTA